MQHFKMFFIGIRWKDVDENPFPVASYCHEKRLVVLSRAQNWVSSGHLW